jgi:hypothetical protein
MKLGVGDSWTWSKGKGTEGAVGSKAVRLGSAPDDGTQYARGEANMMANPGAKKTGNDLDKGENKPPAPRWCPQGFSKTQ